MLTQLKSFIQSLPQCPGVYQMFDDCGELLYVGKAKNIKKRVTSYLRVQESPKVQLLVQKISHIEATVTNTEAEALLLEQTLIKNNRPPFNIVLRDDKSYPYIQLTSEHTYPRMCFYRGSINRSGYFYGPFVNSALVREALNILQKVFKVRQCDDVFFRNRTRPCLQYQMHRCTAPCVGLISEQNYARDIESCRTFLQGKNQGLINSLIEQMEQASSELEYEKAAQLRDQIVVLRNVQAAQHVAGGSGDVDALAVKFDRGLACVSVLHVRQGNVVGNQHFLLKAYQEDAEEVLEAFISQFYDWESHRRNTIPAKILLNINFEGKRLLEQVLAEQAQHKVEMLIHVRQERAAWLKMSEMNACQHLESRLSDHQVQFRRFVALQEDLSLPELPERLECFDISHTAGEATVASCVVFDSSGPKNREYRHFNIKHIKPGDDYAAMEQVVTRRYERLKREEARLPDIIIIDGGFGQINKAARVLEELQVSGPLLLSVCKGPGRKASLDSIYMSEGCDQVKPIKLSTEALNLVQHLRDEAHRFAITGHRTQRDKKRKRSEIEGIVGIGPKRRRLLLTHFGGLQGLRQASIEDLKQLPGISAKLAEEIYMSLQR